MADYQELPSLDVTQIAAHVRKAVKAAFPATKFSVRSSKYAGGSSVDVEWWDGPTSKQVEVIVKKFDGVSFDSSTDSTDYHPIKVDGKMFRAHSHVMTQRRLSAAFLHEGIEVLTKSYHLTPEQVPTVFDSKFGASLELQDYSWVGDAHYSAADFVYQWCHEHSRV